MSNNRHYSHIRTMSQLREERRRLARYRGMSRQILQEDYLAIKRLFTLEGMVEQVMDKLCDIRLLADVGRRVYSTVADLIRRG